MGTGRFGRWMGFILGGVLVLGACGDDDGRPGPDSDVDAAVAGDGAPASDAAPGADAVPGSDAAPDPDGGPPQI